MKHSQRAGQCQTAMIAAWILLAGLGPASCIRHQAPGDGDPICIEETIGGGLNPFFANRPVYSPNERPLMDSRDYVRLLAGSGNVYLPWQSVDRDNNNAAEIFTEVYRSFSINMQALVYY